MKKLLFGLILLIPSLGEAAVNMFGQRLRIAEVDYSTYAYPTTLAFQDGELSCVGSTCTVTVTGGGGGGGGGTLEVLFPGILSSSPTTTINFDTTTFRGADSGSTATVRINFSSITAMGAYPADGRFTLFLTTGQQKINDAGGFTAFIATFTGGASTFTGVGFTDESDFLGRGSSITCSGAGVTCTQANGVLTMTIPGGAGGGGSVFRIETTTIAIVRGNSEGGLEGKNRTVNSFQNFGSTTMFTDTANRVTIGTGAVRATLVVSTGAGVNQPLFIVSTGTTKILEVTGSSVVINAGVGLNIDAGQVVIGNSGTIAEGGTESTLVVVGGKAINSVGAGITAYTNLDTRIARFNAVADNTASRIAVFGAGGETSSLFTNAMYFHNRNLLNGMRFYENGETDNLDRPIIVITTTSLVQVLGSTMTPPAKFYISSGTYYGANTALNTVDVLFIISSGSALHNNYTDMRVMEVGKSSASFRVPLYISAKSCDSVDTDSEGQLICGTDNGGAGAGADGNLTNVATQAVNLGGYALFNVSSMSFAGSGAPIIGSTFPMVQFKVTDEADTDFEVNESSVVVPTTSDFIFNSSDTYFPKEYSMVRVATSIVNMATMTFFNHVIFEQQRSTGNQEYMIRLDLADMDTAEPQLVYALTNSTGTDPHPISFSIAIATATGRHVAPTLDTLIWNSSFTIVTSTPGYATVEHINSTSRQLTGWAAMFGSGVKEAYMKVINVAGTGTCQRVVKTIGFKKRKRT